MGNFLFVPLLHSVSDLSVKFPVKNALIQGDAFLILGFHRKVDEKCSLLGYKAANTCNFLPTFRDNITVPFLGAVNSILLDSRPLMMGPIGCPEM
jgi:hypothetical protein